MVSVKMTARKSIWLAWVILSIGLIATIVTTIYVKMDVEADAKREFTFACNQIQLRIDARMAAHEQILMGAAALFDASEEVTREEWHAYTQRQKIEQHFPGIQGIGFSLMVPREKLEQHLQEIHSQGFPDYKVEPEGDREIYTAIIYLEPFSWRNRRAFGYDMLSESVRRKAMEQAMDLDMAVLSGKVLLVQETDQDIQAGTLMYVPVYRTGMATDTVANRRAALYGWVYSPYRMNDLMQGILKGWDLEGKKQIRLQIFDTGQLSADSLLYDSLPEKEMDTVSASRLTLQIRPSFKNWSLCFTQIDEQNEYGRVYSVLSGGTMISLLLFWLFSSILNTRFRAYRLADQLTVDLRESEEKYRGIFTAESDAVFLIDKETGAIIETNNAICDIYGYTQEELIRLKNHDLSAEPEKTMQATKELKRTIPLRYHRKKDGTIFPVDISSSSFILKGRDVILAVIRDITERKQAEEILRDYRWRLESIIEGTNIGTWEWNVQTGETVFNKIWAQIVGYTLEELEPITIKTWEAFVHPDDFKTSGELLKRHFAGELPYYDCECRMRHKDGHWVEVHDRGKVVTWTPDGKPQMMFGTHQDITLQKQMEAKTFHLQKAESLSRIAGAIAHHFNNQLYVVIGSLELVLEDLPDDAEIRENLLQSMMAAQKAAAVNQQMLIYLGQTSATYEPIDLSRACRKSLPLLQAAIPKGIILNIDFPDSGPVIRAEEGHIQQILTHLATNAWESISGNQGSIGLTIRTVAYGDIPPSKRFPMDWQPQPVPHACIEVSDTGCGISNNDFEKLFDPFFTTKFTGRGMGLPVVKGVAKAQGGCITVDSEPGRGSVFQVFLPISTEKIPLPLEQEKPEATTVRKVETGGTVLLIEDEAMIRNTAKIVLTRLGYTVLEAQDGVEAVEIFQQRQNEICCVLSDLTMPRMGGWETLTALRKMRADVPVIIASGHDKDVVMAGNHPDLPQAFLYKPYSKAALKEALAKAMRV